VSAPAQSRVEKYPSGKVKARYRLDRNGQYVGAYTEFFENGRKRLTVSYEDGQKEGEQQEYDEKGRLRITSNWQEGKVHGQRTEFDERREVVLQELWLFGVPAHPRSKEEIETALNRILVASPADAESLENKRQVALRRIRAYRYLVGVAQEGLVLGDELNQDAQRLAEFFHTTGQFAHEPTNPGIPESEFAAIRNAGVRCNLHQHNADVIASYMVDKQMWDSDSSNRDRVLHRRWLLNPPLGRIGIGIRGHFGTLWVHDTSNREAKEEELLALPARGHMPVDFFHFDQASKDPYVWSLMLNPGHFDPPDAASISVRVSPLDTKLRRGDPILLRHVSVHLKGTTKGPYALLFQPIGVIVRDGKRYWVEVDGLRQRSEPRPISYLVDFYRSSSRR
jgi:hypothetical protein